MKSPVKYIFPAVMLLFAFSCEKSEPIKEAESKCGEVTGKFVWNWCTELGAIEVISNNDLGSDWAWGTKRYRNVVLAKLDSTLVKSNENWSRVIGSSDSIIYFNYRPTEFDYGLVCKVLGGPTNTISITSFGSFSCQLNDN